MLGNVRDVGGAGCGVVGAPLLAFFARGGRRVNLTELRGGPPAKGRAPHRSPHIRGRATACRGHPPFSLKGFHKWHTNPHARATIMKTSTELMREVDRELMWGGAVWFLWGVGGAVGNWLGIDALKTDRTGSFLWFGFGGAVGLGIIVANCTKAVLAAIRESSKKI